MARLASVAPPLRASSIIPSKRPRIETPRRAASASTQARRSWSRRMPTTVDFEVAIAPLTVIRGVYSSGAEWWQPGGGHRRRGHLPDWLRHASADGSRPRSASPDSGRCRTFSERVSRTPSESPYPGVGEPERSGVEPPSDGAPGMVAHHSPAHPCGHALEVHREAGDVHLPRDPVDGPWRSSVAELARPAIGACLLIEVLTQHMQGVNGVPSIVTGAVRRFLFGRPRRTSLTRPGCGDRR